MPAQGPGQSHDATATKAVLHGDPCIETNIPGIAFQSKQSAPYADPTLTATRTIQIGDDFVITGLGRNVEVRTAAFSGASLPTVGAKLYIIAASNLLTTVSTGNVKFGICTKVLTSRGLAVVNTNLKDAF